MTAVASGSAVSLAARIAGREISPVEVIDGCLAEIEAANPAINAFCLVAAEEARAEAESAERAVLAGEELGPLHGVPVGIKDLTETKGMRTTYGSRAYEKFVPSRDATVVARLRQAGAIVVGKTTSPEFGLKGVCENPLHGRTNNPWNLDRTAGGSSGGSAAAIAAGMVPIAEGSDGAGSIRIPASCCGVVGMKASFGRVPLFPRNPFESLVHTGPMAGTVRDAAVMLAAMAGPADDEVYGIVSEPEDYRALAEAPDLRGWRIAYSPDLGLPGVDAETVAATEAAAEALRGFGAEVEAATPDVPDPREAMMVLWQTAYGTVARDRVLPHIGREEMDPDLVTLLEAADQIDAATFHAASGGFRAQFFRAMLEFFADYRVLLTPTLSRTAMEHPADGLNPAGVEGTDAERFLGWFRTYHFNLTGQPAISVPCGQDSDGLPIGLQIVGRPRADADVIAVAAAHSLATPWAEVADDR